MGADRPPGPGAAGHSGYLPVSEHGLIGDLHSVALVGTNGTIDWHCSPSFDSPSVFGSLLDAAPTLGAGLDWKTSLQELTAARNMGAPSYVVTSTGPDHEREFTAVAVVLDTEYGTGVGRTKKEAEARAAAAAWKALEVLDTAGKTSV